MENFEIPTQYSNSERAYILGEALPYIKKYSGKTIVVKYGGNAMINEELKQSVIHDLILMQYVGIKVILVHGGGPEINNMLGKIGKEAKFIDGLRYTDKETMDIVQQVLSGKVNKDLVQLIEDHGGKAIGLCGLDGSMLKAKKTEGTDLGFVGDVTHVNTDVILNALDGGYIPVISTVASGYDKAKGDVYNINADIAAAKIAAALKAQNFILMTDTKGLLEDVNDESTLIYTVALSDVPKLKADGIISGGMIPKIDCCVDAMRQGVKSVNIIDGREPHSLLIELFTDKGIGTMFV